MATSGKVTVSWSFNSTSGSNTLGTATDPVSIPYSRTLSDGTAADEIDISWSEEFTLTSGSANNHDFAGTLVNAFGATLTAVEVIGVIIVNTTETTGNFLTVGAATAPMIGMLNAAGTIVVGPGGCFVNISPVDGFAVTATTGDLLKVLNSGSASVTYKIGFVARSA